MPAWVALLRDRASIKRATLVESDSGSTTRDFSADPIATGVACSIQDSGGQMRQDDFGQRGQRGVKLVFQVEVDLLQGDLVVDERTGLAYEVVHVHVASGGHHLRVAAKQWVNAGGD